MSGTRIGVVIPCYDMGRYLPETLRSVFAQTRPPDEIVVVDDGSTDPRTRELLATLPPRARVVRQTNRGPGEARNAGIRAMSAELVLPLDADDLLAPRALERYESALLADPGASFAYGHVRFFGALRGRLDVPPFNPYLELEHNRLVVTALIRRNVFSELGAWYPPMRVYEDWSFWLSCAKAELRGTVVEEELFLYRRKTREGLLFEADRDRESSRAALRTSHADLYSDAARARLKARYAPGLEILWRDGASVDELEELLRAELLDDVAIATDVPASAREYAKAARGKYAVDLLPGDLRALRAGRRRCLADAIHLMEEKRDLYSVAVAPDVVVWRVAAARLLRSAELRAAVTTREFALRTLRRGIRLDATGVRGGERGPAIPDGARAGSRSVLAGAWKILRPVASAVAGGHRIDAAVRAVRSVAGEKLLGWPCRPGEAGTVPGTPLLPRSRRVELSLLDNEPVRLGERADGGARSTE